MDSVIRISQLNDFLFCPYSIYLHNIYEDLEDHQYHDVPQVKGSFAHETIDNGSYSTKASEITGLDIYSEKYALVGRIDQYFMGAENGTNKLIERKRKIGHIYDGHKLQIYAQYYCMIEMGYKVDQMNFYSMVDNKSLHIEIPDMAGKQWFEGQLRKVRCYDPSIPLVDINQNKCRHCIYSNLCDQTKIFD